MNLEEYSSRQRSLSRALVALVIRLFSPFRVQYVTLHQWEVLLNILFPAVDNYRRDSARLAREFFDSEWAKHRPDVEPPPIDLPPYRREYLSEDLEPAREAFSQQDAPPSAVMDVAELAMKQIENAGRRTILRGVQESPDDVRFARVLTGLENCGFCVMLASRGPVYYTRESAGDPEIRTFHKGCDCKVVPVHDRSNWPGRESYLEALELWRTATRGYRGKDALNALRRYLAEEERAARDASAA